MLAADWTGLVSFTLSLGKTPCRNLIAHHFVVHGNGANRRSLVDGIGHLARDVISILFFLAFSLWFFLAKAAEAAPHRPARGGKADKRLPLGSRLPACSLPAGRITYSARRRSRLISQAAVS
jgi:hypothetical protein